MLADFRVAWRSLLGRPAFSIVAVLALALGIDATTAIFSVVDAVLLRPLPYPEPERLVRVHAFEEPNRDRLAVSGMRAALWTEANRGFDAMAAYRETRLNATGPAGPERLEAAVVARSFFDVIGQPLLRGRPLSREHGTREVVISEGLWRGR